MEFIKDLFENYITEADQRLLNKMRDAKRIITSYSSAQAPYNDFILRIAGFTKGDRIPDKNKPAEIDIIPALDDLAKKGYVIKKPNGAYKSTDVISRLISMAVNDTRDRASQGDLSKDGKLSTTQVDKMHHMAGDGTLGQKLNNAELSYKAGGKYSGVTKELILKMIKRKDGKWEELSDSAKAMVDKLNTLDNPLYSFKVLKLLISLRSKKKGYTDFITFVKDYSSDEGYVNALLDLQNIGVVDVKNNTLNSSAIKDIRNVMNYMEEPTVEDIKPVDKVSAFLPKFFGSAVSTTGETHRRLNQLVSLIHPSSSRNKAEFVRVYGFIKNKLTDDQLASIMTDSGTSLPERIIKYLGNALNVSTKDELVKAIDTKFKNREDFKSDTNKEAKNTGRFDEFIKNFSI